MEQNAIPEVTEIVNYSQLGEDMFDPFNGIVAIFENLDRGAQDERFWVEHQRKDIYSEYLTQEEAEKLAAEFVSDTIF